MPANGFNIGRDVTLDLVTPNGILRPTIRSGFSAKQMTHSLSVNAADGNNLYDEIPAGWEGTLDFDRADSQLDDYFAQRETDYFNGVANRGISITETITELSGAVTQYRYTRVSLKYDDSGEKKGNDTIKQKVSWKASRRIKVA